MLRFAKWQDSYIILYDDHETYQQFGVYVFLVLMMQTPGAMSVRQVKWHRSVRQ